MLVVDASIAVELSLDRMGSRPLREHELVAPALLWSEVPCALSQLAYRRDIGRDLVERAFSRFVDGKIAIAERRPVTLDTRLRRGTHRLDYVITPQEL